MKAKTHTQLSTSHNRSQRISSLWERKREEEEGWKRKLKMLMSVKAPWPPFPFFPYSDLLKIRVLQCRQHKHSSWKYSENPGFMQEVWVKYQLQGLKQWCTKGLLSFALCKAPKPTVRRKGFLFFFSVKVSFLWGKSGKYRISLI